MCVSVLEDVRRGYSLYTAVSLHVSAGGLRSSARAVSTPDCWAISLALHCWLLFSQGWQSSPMSYSRLQFVITTISITLIIIVIYIFSRDSLEAKTVVMKIWKTGPFLIASYSHFWLYSQFGVHGVFKLELNKTGGDGSLACSPEHAIGCRKESHSVCGASTKRGCQPRSVRWPRLWARLDGQSVTTQRCDRC